MESDDTIILRLTEFSETSQIATLFSRAHGLLRLIAKGARRGTKTRFATGLDLLEYGELGFLPAHGDAQLGTLTDWRQRDAFAGLRRDLLRLYGALYAAELVASLTEEADPHPDLFAALLRTLQDLAAPDASPPPADTSTSANPGVLLARFQWQLLTAIGYAPNLAACVSCGRPAPPGRAAWFSAGAGGLLCRDCEPHHVEKYRVPAGLLGAAPTAATAAAWFELFDYHLTYVAGRRLRTARRVAELLRRLPAQL